MTATSKATGKIEVQTYEPSPYDQPEGGPTLIRIHVEETFHGDIDAKGIVDFIQVGLADGSASFVGVEKVIGSLAGREGSFVLQDQGTVEGSTVSGTWFVVPRSGTGGLVGLRGDGGFTAVLGQAADIFLDYWFE